MKRILALILVCAMVALWGCSGSSQASHSATYYDLFDTVTTISAQMESKADFDKAAQKIHDELLAFHKLFDIYNSYDGIVNLKYVNENAGIAPVKVSVEIIDLLQDCKAAYALTGGRVNVAMGAVLDLWHQARSQGIADPEHAKLPDQASLQEAAKHTDIDSLIIDEESGTVYFSDPLLKLDVGAVAKGWATQIVAQNAPAGMLLSVGGNVCSTGPKADGSSWNVAVQHPDDAGRYLHILSVSDGCVVTSGDYQRTYTVDGKFYHHIIDPDTLYPAAYWRAVTVICADSGMADILSTALFLLSLEEGQALLDKQNAQAVWIDADGKQYYSDGFQAYIKK